MLKENKINTSMFGKNESLALKGIAIALMMMHHCFNNSEMLSPYDISFVPFTESSVLTFSHVCKICVSIYAFIFPT